jgi:hypothetical protein
MSDLHIEAIAVPLYYDDGKVIHACESYFMHPDREMVRTKCDKVVLPSEAFTLTNATIDVTCEACRKARGTADVGPRR